MRSELLAFALLLGVVGCHHTCPLPSACPPHVAPEPDACQPTKVVQAPRTRVEVHSAEDVVVKAPRQKVIVDSPPPPCAQQKAAAPTAAQAMQCLPPVCGMPYGQPGIGAVPVAGQVRERSSFGFVLDTINIPLPIFRPIAIPRPSEVTLQVPPAQAVATSAISLAAAPMVVPMAMPQASFAQGVGMPMVPQPTVGYQQVTVQGQVTGQQAASLQAALAAQGSAANVAQLTPQQLGALLAQTAGVSGGTSGQAQVSPQQLAALLSALQSQGASASGAVSQAPGSDSSTAALQERLKATEKQLKELEALCAKVKEIRQPSTPAGSPLPPICVGK